MIETKLFEVRDAATFLPVLAVAVTAEHGIANESEMYMLRRTGYALFERYVILMRLAADGTPCNYDPYSWSNRTLHVAHMYIIEHWAELSSGDVVDVEFILGLRTEPKASERLTAPGV